ncbi:PmoA family protein [Actinosynnema pretiosum subsp. pretiosum]|uniref:PmoA family protein n=1 Tax=Actinosynnema pretiosum subsp. pretiosum TaxID=103721 RepID=A0AA45L6M5_9PSEU|nr:hypothetical protein APASM_4883 [Actinosynnema pretiosum subsp. pretiosum]QUF03805.1 PmoA family protein [Actinosynnema pretiosum subsp. pretiosum]
MSGFALRHDVGVAVGFLAGGVELARYEYAPGTPRRESPKPFLHPVRTRSGRLVSLFRPHDHVWHKGIAWSLPHVGEHNFWGGPTYLRGRGYAQLDNNGAQVHRRVTGLGAHGDGVRFAHELDWVAQDGRAVLTESRVLTAVPLGDSAWGLTFDTTMTNTSGAALVFGSPTTNGRDNAGYGGLFWRGPRSFTGGVVITSDGVGGDELRGWRGEWMAFCGRHDGDDAESLVLAVDHVGNPHHPPRWFTRSANFACLNPAPFFSEEFVVGDGESARFRYGVGIADGGADGAVALAEAVRGVLG